MPEKKRERFVPDEEARELERLFIMRDVRRYCSDREIGTLYHTEKWKGTAIPPSCLRQATSLCTREALRTVVTVLGFALWIFAVGAIGSVERGRVDVLPGMVLAAVCAAVGAFCIMLGEVKR